ncbi:hypothetical protein DFH09DRAFT_1311452 [Mycena vulgaris]|nr:hypothetical protein DFH09DRAFT_1311452 [Mycena vulgaris]
MGLRGSVAQFTEDYNKLRRLGVPVWLELTHLEGVALDPTKKVQLSPLRIENRKWDEMQVDKSLRDTHKGKLVHNKVLDYYPPVVEDPEVYELAARGYRPRQDIFTRDIGSWNDVLKMLDTARPSGVNHNKSAALGIMVRDAGSTAGELMEKYASDRAIAPAPDVVPAPSASKSGKEQSRWYRQYLEIQSARTTVPWAPPYVEAWGLASLNSDYFPLVHNAKLEPKFKTLLLYILPPPHLFLGVKSLEKLHGYFFIWMCIRRAWLSQVCRESGDPIYWGLTTQQWRDILSGQYWKYRHPRSEDTKFELRRFWKYGGPLVFEQEPGVAEPDISPEMASSSSGRLEPMHFADDSIKALVLWDLALCHSQLQLDHADELLCASSITDPVELSVRRTRRADVFYSPDWNWNITNQVPPWEKALSDKGRRHWLSRLLEIVKDWPCASKMAWFLAENGFHAIQQHVGKPREAKFCEQLSDGKVQMLENSMVAAYYQGVFDSMGILAIGIMKRPKHMPSMNAFYLM